MQKQVLNTYALASDHAGFELKEKIKSYLKENSYNIIDLGPFSNESVDYPDYGKILGKFVLENKNALGIAICGSGIGISIALNRLPGIRAALCNSEEIAKLSRNHNNANILVLAGRFITMNKSSGIIDTFFKETFEGGRHERRVNKLG
ncbi:MAG: ribose 5-phosphate isomerase B [Pelagibacterales bacterium]|nr:ribose 5-phosphate isomerase B [Pelagibacterales bacterium]PPR15267.1 MAG: putative ribose-5-phosphate isomerase B [Alphaproteobacteria bacterium MarineAlpha9_Bin3]